MNKYKVDIVNEKDQVVGQASRIKAHQKELHHRLVAVWFYNTKGQVLIQKRAWHKKDLPGILEWTVSGHVDAGETYEQALLRETQEETGVRANIEDFELLGLFVPNKKVDGRRVTHFRKIYALRFDGAKESLHFDPKEVDSFEWWDVPKLLSAIEKKDNRFFEFFWHPFCIDTIKKVQEFTK